MGTKKRVLSAIIAIAMFASSIVTTAFANADPTITISSAEAKAGDTVDVTFSIDGNPGIVALRLSVAFDSSALTLTNVTDGGILGQTTHGNGLHINPYILYWNNVTATEDFTTNGTLATLTFAVKDDAAAGDYDITATIEDSFNVDIDDVDFEVVNGTITVVEDEPPTPEYLYGDVNNDCCVNAEDIVVLAHYLAKWSGFTPDNFKIDAADVCSDGEINAFDDIILAHYLYDSSILLPIVYSPQKVSSGGTLTVSKSAAYAGDTVDVTLSLADNPGLSTMRLAIEYDDEALTLVNVADAGVLGTQVHGNNLAENPYFLYWFNGDKSQEFTANGTIVTLTFEVSEDAEPGDYEINAVPYEIIKSDLSYYDFSSIVSGGITVCEDYPPVDPPVNKPQIKLSSAEAMPGETFDVDVSLANNPGIIFLRLNVGYDSNALELVNVTDKGILGTATHGDSYTANPYTLYWQNSTATQNFTANGTIATLTFKVKESAAAGDYDITVNILDSLNVDLDDVTFDSTNGNVTVTAAPAPIPVGQIAVSNANAEAGDTVDVTVSLKDNPGIVSLRAKVGYNGDALELVNVTDAGVLGANYHSPTYENNPYTLYWSNSTATENFTANGTVATLTFKVKETAATGNYGITVNFTDGLNVDVNDVNFNTVNGNIAVTAKEPVDPGAPQISVSEATAIVGGTANVNISLANNPGITMLRLEVSYDSNALELVKVTDAGVLGTKTHGNSLAINPYVLYWSNGTAEENFTANGTVATLTFKAKDDAAAGNYNIAVNILDSMNVDLDDVEFAVTNGKVSVTDIIHAAYINLNKSNASIERGSTTTLVATVGPENATNKNVTWSSSNEAVATVDANGVVTAQGAGTATITATTEDGGFTASCNITVFVRATGVSLDKASASIEKGSTTTIAATVAPADATNKNVTWTSSNEAVATVSNGIVTAVSAGYATITATTEDGGFTASCDITVFVSATGVSLDKASASIERGTTETLVATVAPYDATNKNVTWTSSNNAVATVDANGVVTAVSAGKATITATTEDGGFTASCDITIFVSATGVSLDKASASIEKGTTETLIATVYPSDATNKSVTWVSSNEAVATVDANGVVTAQGAGTATIAATTVDGGFTANCNVTVFISVTGVSLNKEEISLENGTTEALVATVTPSDATNKNIIWTSSNEAVAIVDASGVVTAQGVGTATITATTEDGGKIASCNVTVFISVTGVSLDQPSISIEKGSSKELTATVAPYDATNKNVTWASSNNAVATVNENGVVTAVAPGTATITVTTADGNFTASCVVTVTISVTSISVDKTSMKIKRGATGSLTATVSPSNATNKNIIWASSNEAVATVINGVVYAVSAGYATITATTEDGGYMASCDVTVVVPVNEKIVVSSAKGGTGSTVDVTVSLENNPGIVSMLLDIDYDKDAMTLVGVKDAGILGNTAHGNDYSVTPYNLYWNNGTASENFTVNGTIATLTFAIKDDAEAMDYPITVSYVSGNILDYNLESVDFVTIDGNITVIDFIYGDVNRDGSVTALDNAILSRYLSKWKGYESRVDLRAADVNADGSVTALDNAILSRYLSKWKGYTVLPYKKK